MNKKINLRIYGIHLLNPYKTVVSHLKRFAAEKSFTDSYCIINVSAETVRKLSFW